MGTHYRAHAKAGRTKLSCNRGGNCRSTKSARPVQEQFFERNLSSLTEQHRTSRLRVQYSTVQQTPHNPRVMRAV